MLYYRYLYYIYIFSVNIVLGFYNIFIFLAIIKIYINKYLLVWVI
jgi:hypothetical protein